MDTEENTRENQSRHKKLLRHPVLLLTVATVAAGLLCLLLIHMHWGDDLIRVFSEYEDPDQPPHKVVAPDKEPPY